MSEENVAVIRGVYETTGGGSEQVLAALDELVPALCTEDIEFIETPERVDARTYRGHDGVKEAFRRFYDQWESHTGELIKIEDHGDQVFAAVGERAKGKGSGVPVTNVLYTVFGFREGKVCRYFESYDENLARGELAS
jgi:ketosteroid isomerase-like protein